MERITASVQESDRQTNQEATATMMRQELALNQEYGIGQIWNLA